MKTPSKLAKITFSWWDWILGCTFLIAYNNVEFLSIESTVIAILFVIGAILSEYLKSCYYIK